MNQLVTISYEDRLKAEATARKLRLMGKPRTVNIINEVLKSNEERSFKSPKAKPRADADAHVRAYRIWQSSGNNVQSIWEYASNVCQEIGTTLADMQSATRKRLVVEKRDWAIFEVKQMYPHKSLAEIGRLFCKDHSSIVHSLKREGMKRGCPQEPKPEAVDAYPTLKEDLQSGLYLREIAIKYGVGPATISRKVKALGLTYKFKSKSRPAPDHLVEAIRSDFECGMSHRELVKKYHVSPKTIRKYRERNGWQEPKVDR